MNERSRVMAASVAGAAIGGLIGFLYLTDRGRRMRDEFEPRLDDFVREIRKLRTTVSKAQAVADEGWRSLNELIGEHPRGQWSGNKPAQGQQSSPF
ncbi:MAG: YtxH domain-containing protein [Bacteroidales bacterium]